jgi:hypothetical protein
MNPLLLILIVLLVLGGGFGYRGGYLGTPYAYGPLGLILIVLIVLAILGRI